VQDLKLLQIFHLWTWIKQGFLPSSSILVVNVLALGSLRRRLHEPLHGAHHVGFRLHFQLRFLFLFVLYSLSLNLNVIYVRLKLLNIDVSGYHREQLIPLYVKDLVNLEGFLLQRLHLLQCHISLIFCLNLPFNALYELLFGVHDFMFLVAVNLIVDNSLLP